MRHKTLMASALALLLAGAGSFALAQQATPPSPPPAAAAPGAKPMPHRGGHGDGAGNGFRHGFGMMRGHGFGGPGSGTIADLRALERLYLVSGRTKELPALYNEVLSRSQDPKVREYAYHHLARAQAQPANVDAAIATLRKSLDENLANEAKMRAEHEKMRQEWEQRRSQKASAAGAGQP
ncbi:hypothetical protein [Fulvimonas soli]|jgi:hypothetical protein|uniref:Spy/CpxP family protein refolding chaperone n=1 Tax=Fulvimonas soli TaxID=155197 RepID=A0A316HVI7_9GAMM|nr:hypothetical protein [Fulvimonas soli]PWK84752.1 hypothetical protein C7456_11053 [Fulvimonas soli]TNY27335.1 hypothetical protein BV497_04005 [Fulvimonas soli]